MSALDRWNNLISKKKGKNEIDIENKKCPACGQPINSISATCPLCGYAFRFNDVKKSYAVEELVKEINKIEKRRGIISDSIRIKISGRRINPTDEKIATVIKNFVVPNTKEDIFQFMILASGNIDVGVLVGQESENASEIIVKAWENKFEQTYQKAKILLESDSDFCKIQQIYDSKKNEIDEMRIKISKSKGLLGIFRR